MFRYSLLTVGVGTGVLLCSSEDFLDHYCLGIGVVLCVFPVVASRFQACACPFNLFLLSSGSLSYDIWFCAVRMRQSYIEEWHKISLTFSNKLTILVLVLQYCNFLER